MHILFEQVLNNQDLSRAGDLFSILDQNIVNDLSHVLTKIQELSTGPEFLRNPNNQSVVEICLTRVTSAIRETSTIEEHAPAMVALLESCLNYDLRPSSKDEDPPHAKIASDIVSCIFLNHHKKSVMKMAVPIAVKFLHRGNKELSRNLSSYLSLAAINNAELLAPHIQPIIDSIIAGNYGLARVLCQIYKVNPEPIHDHVMALVSLLPLCEDVEKLSLLSLFGQLAQARPKVLEDQLPQLSECLTNPATASPALHIFLDMAPVGLPGFPDHLLKIKIAAELQPGCLGLAACILGLVGKLSPQRGQECLEFLMTQLARCGDQATLTAVLKAVRCLTDTHPALLGPLVGQICDAAEPSATPAARQLIQQLRADSAKYHPSGMAGSPNNGSTAVGGVTIVKLTGWSRQELAPRSRPSLHRESAKSLGSLHTVNNHRLVPSSGPMHHSRSTFGIHSSSSVHRSMNALTKLNARLSSGGVTVMTPQKSIRFAVRSIVHISSSIVTATAGTSSSDFSSGSMPTLHEEAPLVLADPLNLPATAPVSPASGASKPHGSANPQRVSVFEPYPMRDAIQHFCEKHLEKIKAYMVKVFVKIPLPVKCTIEERKSKKHAKLYFGCQGRGPHCLYNSTFFGLKTTNPRTWIHLMFLALQARASSALSTREQSVSSLKNCWDTLKADTRSFLTLVTSAFPSAKDQDLLIAELRHHRYFDVFEYNGPCNIWGCFLCNHPDRAVGFLQEGEPVIEGQLKEKKGKWKLFRRWRTRYFTLSGAHLSYRDSKKGEKDGQPIEVSQIRSVRPISSRGRNIPKAFEIFTQDKTFVFKAKDGSKTEQWVQCLSIAMARSQAKETPSQVVTYLL